MPRSPLPNISVPVFAGVACCAEVVLELDFLSLLPQAARKSANALAAPVPPTAFRKRLRSDGSVASRPIADGSSCMASPPPIACGRTLCADGSRAAHAHPRQVDVRYLTDRSVGCFRAPLHPGEGNSSQGQADSSQGPERGARLHVPPPPG